jgi:cobyrinic acid a,c-diamide synthase
MDDRVLIGGTHSGCGKTTVTCAVLAALKNRGVDVRAFKCGPDYIDPMFHRAALGIPSENLDPFFSTGAQLRNRLACRGQTLSLIEGVMGYYDGVGIQGRYGTYDVAKETQTPAILVVNARGMYTSAGALIAGFRDFRADNGIRGVIFNETSSTVYNGLSRIAADAGLLPLGFLPPDNSTCVKSRHLGLITPQEMDDLHNKLAILSRHAEQNLDLDGILHLASQASPLVAAEKATGGSNHVRIAVAKDEAFCFLYQENLSLLRDLGAELVYFSPLRDAALPERIGGLYLPGGYPELYAEKLSANDSMRNSVRHAIEGSMPAIAECGGFLYLHDLLDGYPMAGIIHGSAQGGEKLQRFGYVTLTALKDHLLCKKGDSIRAHEFHYYVSTDNGADFSLNKAADRRSYESIHATDTLYAGFPHLYFPGNPAFAEAFVGKAADYGLSGC